MKGFSLPVVMLVLCVGGALAAGGSYVARQNLASARADEPAMAMQAWVESLAIQLVAGWDSVERQAQQVGSITTTSHSAGRSDVTLWVTRASPYVYQVVAEGSTRSKTLLRKRLSLSLVVTPGGAVVLPERWMLYIH